MADRKRFATVCGFVAPGIAFVAILLATVLMPGFDWATDALSETGAAGASTFWVFNGGLVATGLVGLPFGWRLWETAANRVERASVAAFWLTLVALALVGVRHLPLSGHAAAAVTHFVAATVTMWVWGTGAVLAGRPRAGLVSIWLGIGHTLFWLVWAGVLAPGPLPGLAVPETVGALAFAAWTVARARELAEASGDGPSASPARS